MKGLTAKLLSLCIGMVTLFAGVAALLYLRAVGGQRDAMITSVEQVATATQSSIAAQFFERYGDVQAFGLNSVFRGTNKEAMTEVLNSYAKGYVIYDLIVFLDKAGKLIAFNTSTPQGKPVNKAEVGPFNFTNEEWFKAVSAGRFTEDAERGFAGTYFEDFHVSNLVKAAAGTDGYVTIFAAPVKDERDQTIGYIANYTNSSWAENEFKNSFDNAKSGGFPYVDLVLMNKKGATLLLYSPDHHNGDTSFHHDFDKVLLKQNLPAIGDEGAQAAMAGTAGHGEFIQIEEGTLHATGFSPVNDEKFVPSIGWTVVAQVASDDLLAGVDAASRMFFIVGGIMLACFIAVGIWFSNRLVGSLRSIASGMSEAGNSVNAASSELQGASQQVSSGATQAASSLEETVASLEQLTSMVRLNSDNAAQAASLAQGSSKTAAEGENEVKALITSITDISQSSQKIEDIINVIDDIAFQTNLLALNAAVEAARAGEQGKGFAVVAEAVRTLAQRSATAAKEISSLIRDNVSKIENGTKLADRSGAVLKEILTSVKKVADISNEIAAASQEQSTGLSQISKAMNELDQSTQRNAATSEQVAASADAMSSQAESLKQLTDQLAGVIYGRGGDTGSFSQNVSSSTKGSESVRKPVRLAFTGTKHPATQNRAHKKPQMSVVPGSSNKGRKNPEEVIPMMDEDQPKENKLSDVSGF